MNLLVKYKKEVVPELKKEFSLKNEMTTPKIEKVIVNSGIGRLVTQNPAQQENIIKESTNVISRITGQKPKIVGARKSISGFKLREGMPVGLKITLRGKRLYDFLTRFLVTALPRVRDFKGIDEKSINDKGIMTIGIGEHTVFPEVAELLTKFNYGLEVTIVPRAKNKAQAVALYKFLGFPIK